MKIFPNFHTQLIPVAEPISFPCFLFTSPKNRKPKVLCFQEESQKVNTGKKWIEIE